MFHRRRHVGFRYLPPFTLCVLVIFALSQVALAAVHMEMEVVGPRLLTVTTPGGGQQVVPELAASGRIIVQLRPDVSPERLDQLLKKYKCTLLKAIPNTPLVVIGLPEGQTVNAARAQWATLAEVVAAEPDYQMYWLAVPNDPLYDQQWQFDAVDAPAGWDVETGAATVTIAILDSGYDPDHPDLVDKYWVNQAELAGSAGVDDDGNGYVDDIYGWDFADDDNDPDAGPQSTSDTYDPGGVVHGTHCAGLAGATSDNGIGVAGHDWGCKLMMLRVGNSFGPFTSDVIEGIQYAVDNGANVISLSVQGMYTTSYDAPIANAHAAGVVVVAAAGNAGEVFTDDPSTWRSPVCNDGPNLGVDNFVLGVGATGEGDVVPDFSNRDASSYSFVDVMAPGVDVWSTYYSNPAFPDLVDEYGPMTGTSMAAPFVAGLCGLVKAHFPSFSADDIINQIRASCDDISDENPLIADTIGQGRINTAAALGLDVPPDPCTNVQAFDTPGDEGGSITVTWTLPDQDDQDVLGYNVLRAGESQAVPNMPGTFTQIAQLPPGTSVYLDAPVPDNTPYWYQVVVFDASNSVPSEIAGPAMARDDTPPPPVDNLVAVDTPADDGGSITLSWDGYEAPSDLAEYRIYRDTTAFTSVAEMEPIATVGRGEGQYYLDNTVEDGVQYWYAVTAVDDTQPEGNEDTNVTAVGPVISNPNFTFNYPAGLSIIALGAMPAQAPSNRIADILGINSGSADLAYWDPMLGDGGGYVLWSENPGNAGFVQSFGRAWWLRSNEPILVNISGEAPAPGDFELSVVSGWNLLGNPFPVRMDFGATEVTGVGEGTPISLRTSNQLGYTRDYAWAYDPFANSYRLVTGVDLPFATRYVDPGRGVFFLARRPATLLLKRESVATAAAAEAEPFDGWVLQLVAEAAGAADVDNYVGVSSRAAELNGVISPPRPDIDLDLYFVRPEADGARLATDFVTSEADAVWTIKVACATPGATVRLSWPDLTTLPAECRPVLVDEATGRTIYLRTSSGYSYEVGNEPETRTFSLRVSEDNDAPLVISALSAGSGGEGAQITYTLSADAAVDVEILNIAGRTVRRLVAERRQVAGPQQIIWDGRNAGGSAVPSGTYLVRIVARTDDGQQVSAVRSLQLQR